MSNIYKSAIKALAANKEEKIQKLAQWTIEELDARGRQYYALYQSAHDAGFLDAAEMHYYVYTLINEALKVKASSAHDTCASDAA